jgi:Co/Zn/Cd efflux system component
MDSASPWVCSRNDIVANGGVIASAGGVALTGNVWPDVLVSLGIVGLSLYSATGVLQAAAHVQL